MQTVSLRVFSKSKIIAFSALFAALCCVSTLWLSVPLPASGYFNTGDVFVLLSGWCLGPVYGGIAAAVGSALADIIVGYGVYAPATFIIKGLDAIVAYFAWSALRTVIKTKNSDFISRILSAFLGELCMVAGYFLFDGILALSLTAALPNLLGNALQGVCCLVCAVLLISFLQKSKKVNALFPYLKKE